MKRRSVLLGGAAALLAGCAGPGLRAASRETGGPSPMDPVVTPTGPQVRPPVAGSTPAHGNEQLLVTDFDADTVTFVDSARGATGSVTVGPHPFGLALDGRGGAWVATATGLALVDTARRSRTAFLPYRTPTGPVTGGEYRGGGMGVAVSPDGRRVYVGVNVPGRAGVLEVVDAERLRSVGAVPVGMRPFSVAVAPDGSAAYAVGHDSFDVTVVRADTHAARRIEVAPFGTEGGLGSWLKPHYAVVRPGDGRLLLPFEGRKLAILDPATGRTTVEPMTADTHQHGVALAADGRLLVVGTGAVDPSTETGPSLTLRHPDGSERLFPLDGPHESVTVSRDGRTAYVSGGYTRDGFWNGLTVIDLDTGATRRLPAGRRPLAVAALPARG